MIVSRGSNPLRDPGRILATPEFKVNDRHRTRTESELTLSTMLADFDPKYPSTRAYFPSERLLATPKVLIPFAPAGSPRFWTDFSARADDRPPLWGVVPSRRLHRDQPIAVSRADSIPLNRS